MSNWPLALSSKTWAEMLCVTSEQKFNITYMFMISLVAQTVNCLPTMRETWVWSLGWEDVLEKEVATHSSTLAWKILWTEEPGRLQSMGSQRVGHDWVTSLSLSYVYAILLPLCCGNIYPFSDLRRHVKRRPWSQYVMSVRKKLDGYNLPRFGFSLSL